MDRLVRLQGLFRDIFDDETLTIRAATTPAEVEGWDSVAQVKIVLAMEAELGVQFKSEEVAVAKTVGDLLTLMQRYSE
jgi:acyl carrier protein